MSFIHALKVILILVEVVSFCDSYTLKAEIANGVDLDSDHLIDFSVFGSNAFIDPDTEITGKLVAEYQENSDQNPEELGAYFEGDILIPYRTDARNALVARSSRWPKGVVPYVIAGKFNSSELTTIKRAFDEYHGRTCVRFKPRSKERDYISIANEDSGCWSAVGKMGGKQQVNLQTPSCLMRPGTILHELMHVLGFIHEQNRHERDQYVTVRTENIKSNMLVNFAKSSEKTAHGMGIGYDYSSVMHYSPTSFSKNGKPTIESKTVSQLARFMGQRFGFSTADVAKINLMYKCSVKDSMDKNEYELEMEY